MASVPVLPAMPSAARTAWRSATTTSPTSRPTRRPGTAVRTCGASGAHAKGHGSRDLSRRALHDRQRRARLPVVQRQQTTTRSPGGCDARSSTRNAWSGSTRSARSLKGTRRPFLDSTPWMSESARSTINPTSIDDALVVEAAPPAERLVRSRPRRSTASAATHLIPTQSPCVRGRGRPASDPLIVHVDGVAMADSSKAGFPRSPPGLRLRSGPTPHDGAAQDRDRAGCDHQRWPDRRRPVSGAPGRPSLITASGVPVAAPSANRFGRISPTTAATSSRNSGTGST